MIKIAHETPADTSEIVRENTDLDFIIAPYAIESNWYLEKHKKVEGRMSILDNGFFECKQPVTMECLLALAKVLNTDYVILPDYLADFKRTRIQMEQNLRVKSPQKYAAVIVGHSVEEMLECYAYYQTREEIVMYCWTFMSPRAIVFNKLSVDRTKKHHLLGFSTCQEFKIVKASLEKDFSIDTMKPVSAAYNGVQLTDCGRGKYKRPDLTQKCSDKNLLKENIAIFKSWITSD